MPAIWPVSHTIEVPEVARLHIASTQLGPKLGRTVTLIREMNT